MAILAEKWSKANILLTYLHPQSLPHCTTNHSTAASSTITTTLHHQPVHCSVIHNNHHTASPTTSLQGPGSVHVNTTKAPRTLSQIFFKFLQVIPQLFRWTNVKFKSCSPNIFLKYGHFSMPGVGQFRTQYGERQFWSHVRVENCSK